MVFVYLDDIFVLNSSVKGVQKDLEFILQTLQDAWMLINWKKSVLEPKQVIQHLWFQLDFKKDAF